MLRLIVSRLSLQESEHTTSIYLLNTLLDYVYWTPYLIMSTEHPTSIMSTEHRTWLCLLNTLLIMSTEHPTSIMSTEHPTWLCLLNTLHLSRLLNTPLDYVYWKPYVYHVYWTPYLIMSTTLLDYVYWTPYLIVSTKHPTSIMSTEHPTRLCLLNIQKKVQENNDFEKLLFSFLHISYWWSLEFMESHIPSKIQQ
jgi:hypothetical protein